MLVKKPYHSTAVFHFTGFLLSKVKVQSKGTYLVAPNRSGVYILCYRTALLEAVLSVVPRLDSY